MFPRPPATIRYALLGLALLAAASGPRAEAQLVVARPNPLEPGEATREVQFDQKLGGRLPLDVSLTDEQGREVVIAEYFGRRPVIINLVYFRCPMLCDQVLRGLARSLKPLEGTPGVDFDVLTVSIDPSEGPDLASQKKAAVLDFYGRPEAAGGWHFLTTKDPKAIDRLAGSVGFRFLYNERTRQYVHAAGVVVTTPRGVVSRYYYGHDFSPRDLKAGIEAAAREEVGSKLSKLLLLCYDYDPTTGKYTMTIMSLLRVLGVATLAGMGSLVAVLSLRERRRRAAATQTTAPTV